MQEHYVNLFTDFGFKKIFGEEPRKDLLISFLNTLLPAKHHIQDLQYARNEYAGSTALDRKAIFDLHCVSASGERFIVELQKAKQSPYRAMRLLQKQLLCERSNQLVIYSISVLDTVFASSQEVVHIVQFKDQNGVVACDKLIFIYLTLPNFHKTLEELETLQDQWFYLFRHLHELTEIPAKFQAQVFRKLFEAAQIACFNPAERQAYEDSLKYYRDLKNVVDTAWLEGREEGKAEGRMEGQTQLLRKLLALKFGSLPEWVEARLTAATSGELEQWAERVLTAEALEAVWKVGG